MNIDFSIDAKKNTTIILAKNSTGKTTLMQAINWCLYGDDYVNLDNKRNLLNSVVKDLTNKKEEPISVAIEIEEEGIIHLIKRERIVNVNNNKTISETLTLEYLRNDGETIILEADSLQDNLYLDKINRIINGILSKEMAQYFLFDGERIDELGSNSAKSKRDIKEAISAINGFHVLENSVESLTQIKKILNRSFTNKIDNAQLTNLQSEIDEINDTINLYNENIDNNKMKIRENEEEIDDLNDILQNSDDVKELAKERKDLEREEKRTNDNISEKDKIIQVKHREYKHKLIISKLQEKYKELEFNEDAEEKTIPNMEAKSIDTIIERGICICGEKITPEHRVHLLEQRNYQPPISNAQLVLRFKKDIMDATSGLDSTVTAIQDAILFRSDYKENLSYIEESLVEISKKIGNSDSEKIKKYNNKREILIKETRILRDDVAIQEHQIINMEKDLVIKEKEYDKMFSELNKYDYEKIRIDLVADTLSMIEEVNEERRLERKVDIEKLANHHFNEIIYKNKTISINDKFEYSVFEKNGVPASPSEGERIAISMSLILAIIDAHKKISDEKNKKTLTYANKREFALVMDAAFAKLDNHFSETIAKKLPKSVEQIILFSTEKQFEGAVQSGLNDYIGRMYVLEIPDSDEDDDNALTNEHLIREV